MTSSGVSERVPPAEAIRQAIAEESGLVLLSDTGDGVHAGSPGDSTVLLREALDQQLDGPAFLYILDPDVVDAAAAAGIGARLVTRIGGWSGAPSAEPLEIDARVIGLSEGVRVRLRDHGFSDLGRTALLEIGQVKLVVCRTRSIAMLYPVLYTHLGLDIADAKMLMLKTSSNFQFYVPWTRRLIRVDSPGPSQSELRELPWANVTRPLYPLDEVPEWNAEL